MLPFFRMLDQRGLQRRDLDAAGFEMLAEAVQRCHACAHRQACIRWLSEVGGRARHGFYRHAQIPHSAVRGDLDTQPMPLEEFERRSMEKANAILERIAERARANGVEVHSDATLSDRPWEAIIEAAKKHCCDVIFIATHARKGLSALVHGSETHEVLTHSEIPAIVVR
jgi:nucleotide-binding universal stress UspA family protein